MNVKALLDLFLSSNITLLVYLDDFSYLDGNFLHLIPILLFYTELVTSNTK